LKTLTLPQGTPAEALLPEWGTPEGTVAAVKVNNAMLPLAVLLQVNARVEPVLLASRDGAMIYRRSLAFLLALAANETFPGRGLRIGHSLGAGYYYTFADEKRPAQADIDALSAAMAALAAQDLPINVYPLCYEEALALFEKTPATGTAGLLRYRNDRVVYVNECAGFADLYTAPLTRSTGVLRAFELRAYEDGFLLRFPHTGEGDYIGPFEDSPKIFAVYREYKKWGRIVGVHSVEGLNRLAADGDIREYIRIAEAFQEKKLAEIADRIDAKKGAVKAVLIAGPSSSGKTTTAKRLSIQLKVLGLDPIAISLDDYYKDRKDTPLDEKGEPDYECLEALDVPFFNAQLLDLFAGREVTLPLFDFKAGRRRADSGRRIRLEERSVLVIEGIHGLNNALTPQVPAGKTFRLYVSALTQLNLDDHNRIPTSDNRLIRRMVRDSQFRGAGAAQTFAMWPAVQQGERVHIFPFQNSADAAFNSALDYELAVLKFYAEPLLRSVKPDSPAYAEALRLLAFLENFAPIAPECVPGQSILREFIGGSEFSY
jgi:uridine kinase